MDMNPSPWAPNTITRYKPARRPFVATLVDGAAVLIVLAILIAFFWDQLEPIFSLIGKTI